MPSNKKHVLFICTHNSARSQIAEGILRSLYSDHYEVHSAGTHPTTIHPYAIQAMDEIGIDISKHSTKSINELKDMTFDYIVTVCDHAQEACPFFPGGKNHIHKGFADPSVFKGSESEKLAFFRQIRDEINDWIKTTFA